MDHLTPSDLDPRDPAACDCPQDRAAGAARADGAAFSRRGVLRAGLAGAGLGALATVVGPGTATQYAFGAPAYDGDTLVVLSLRGGVDTLNVVVPWSDPDYVRLRPTIRVPEAAVLKLDATFGLHPALAPLRPLWDRGALGIVHSTGQVDPTRSHFDAMRELERAAPGSSERTGWLERVAGLRASTGSFQVTQVGAVGVPAAFNGPTPKMTLSRVGNFTLTGVLADKEVLRWTTALTALHATAPAAVRGPATTTLGALRTAKAVADRDTPTAAGATYPATTLGRALADVARLVKARVGLQVACVDHGNWDMHVGMGKPDKGWMRDQLAELAQALVAFSVDLGPDFARTSLVTLTEFGRRVTENASGGVDHGHGSAMLLLGGGMVGGRVHGGWPTLAPTALDSGDLAVRNDYRQVLAEVLVKRCRLQDATSVFPGLQYRPLGVARAL